MTENNNNKSRGIGTTIIVGMLGISTMGLTLKGLGDIIVGEKYHPTNTRIEYVNNDSLPNIVYKTGEVYLQTKEGSFVSYDDVLEQEKAKLDLIYQVKQDSLKRVFENKLEKGVK